MLLLIRCSIIEKVFDLFLTSDLFRNTFVRRKCCHVVPVWKSQRREILLMINEVNYWSFILRPDDIQTILMKTRYTKYIFSIIIIFNLFLACYRNKKLVNLVKHCAQRILICLICKESHSQNHSYILYYKYIQDVWGFKQAPLRDHTNFKLTDSVLILGPLIRLAVIAARLSLSLFFFV